MGGQILLVSSSDPKTGTTGQNMVPSMALSTQSQGRAQEVSAQVPWSSKPVSGSWGPGPSCWFRSYPTRSFDFVQVAETIGFFSYSSY